MNQTQWHQQTPENAGREAVCGLLNQLAMKYVFSWAFARLEEVVWYQYFPLH
jgi:hypothetical protein